MSLRSLLLLKTSHSNGQNPCESDRVDNSFCSWSFSAARITPPPAEEVTEAPLNLRDDRPRRCTQSRIPAWKRKKKERGGIQKQPEPDGNCDDERATGEAEREREREREREGVVSHRDVFSPKLFWALWPKSTPTQTLQLNLPPPLSSFLLCLPLSAICLLSCWMSNS